MAAALVRFALNGRGVVMIGWIKADHGAACAVGLTLGDVGLAWISHVTLA
jgi:hypothetical protein